MWIDTAYCDLFQLVTSYLSLFSNFREGGLSTAHPIQPGLPHAESQYSEDLDNLRNSSKMAIHDPDPDFYDPYCDPEQANNLLNLRGPDFHDSSLILTDCTKTPSKLDHTAIDMPPVYPSFNAKMQGERRICTCVITENSRSF